MIERVAIGLLFVFCSPVAELAAQPEVFHRYYRDEPVSSVRISPVAVRGRIEEGNVYLTEKEAVEMALEANLDINVLRHIPLLRRWEMQQQRAAYDPVGSFGWTWDRDRTPTASVLQGGSSVTNILTSYNFGYSHPFATGTSFEFSFQGTRNRTTNFFSSLVPAIESQFELFLRQNLLEGFGKNAAEYDIAISRNNLDISVLEFKELAIDVISRVQDRFWELEAALKDMEVREISLEAARTVLEQNQARFEVGTASRLDVVEAEAEVASRREELIRSRYSYRRVQDELIRLITNYRDPREFAYQIIPADTSRDLNGPLPAFDRLEDIAAELRPEPQRADLSIANREVELDRSRDQLKPSLELVLGYQQFGLGGTQVIRDFSEGFLNPPIIDVIPGGLGDSLSQAFGGDFYGYLLGLNFQIPISNTDARSRNARAMIELNRTRLQRESVLQSVGLEIRDAMTQIEMGRARLEAAEAAVNAARERVKGEEARFEVGMGTTRRLIEAQRDLVQAESTVVRARTDLVKSFNLLDQATGRTLEAQGINLEEAVAQNVQP